MQESSWTPQHMTPEATKQLILDWPGPYRISDEAIERERARFDETHRLIAEGKVEEARRIAWWPHNERLAKVHWSRIPVHRCSCGKNAPEGIYGLCGYCKGCTYATPESIPRK